MARASGGRAGILVTVSDDAFLADWCDRYLGARPACVLFRSGHLSEVMGAALVDGRRVVVKARPADPRIVGCAAVQGHLARAGFPCPAPLTGVTRVGGLMVTAETLVPGGRQLPAEGRAALFAGLLSRLVSSAPRPADVPSLAPSPPWAGWDHPGSRLWPDRDDRGGDLNSTCGPEWVDDAARRVRDRLSPSAAPACVGHGDWESQNIRWSDGRPLAVHDWDSVIAQPETAVVGLASAVWPAAGGPGEAATVAQSAEFIASYQRAAGQQWDEQQVREAWAAGLWVRLFNAKKDAADGGGPQLDRLAGEIGDRLALAALGSS
ncbi:MAG TPA: phosphotransferase [Streptosporangiaceae bacterium]|nr:phosphotransferase [Streptosporangiaceae bacterium]